MRHSHRLRHNEDMKLRKRSEIESPEAPEPDPLPKKTYEFRTAHARRASDVDLRSDLVNIVEMVWIEDMFAAWQQIKASLVIGPRRSEHGILTKKLDEARSLSYEAHRLYVTAKREYDRWELENQATNSALWNAATRELEAERKEGSRSKPLTDKDVTAKVMTLHPDEYIAQETKRNAVKLAVENMTSLVKEANEHVEDIRILLAKLRA